MISLRKLHDSFAGRDISEITAADVHGYVAGRRRKKISSATIRRDLTVMSRLMQMARRAGWIATNPVPDGFRDLVRFLARTGCRQEEGASLEWGQLDLVKSTCTFTKTKTRSPRVITLSPRLIGDLIRQRERRRFDQYVFVGPHGDRYSNVTGRFRVLMSKALPDDSQRFQCHDLRHTYAIRSLQQGRSIYDSRHLEHGSVKATEIYLTWLTKRPG